MDGSAIKVRYSQADSAALARELRARYGFSEIFECRLFKGGMNDIYRVKADENTYYLRVGLYGSHDKADYEQEVSAIKLLNDNGISAAAPVMCYDGGYVLPLSAPEGVRYAVMFEEAKSAPSGSDEKLYYSLGSAVARMHAATDLHSICINRPPYDFEGMAYRPLRLIEPFLKHRKCDYEYLAGAVEKMRGFIEGTLSREKPFWGFCHGDIQGGNYFFNGEEPTFFDFDCMGMGWRAYDISVFAMNHDMNFIDTALWKSFLDGYNFIRRLSEAELAAVPAFAALHWIWVMGVHADIIDRNQGCQYMCGDQYFNYFIGTLFKGWYQKTGLS